MDLYMRTTAAPRLYIGVVIVRTPLEIANRWPLQWCLLKAFLVLLSITLDSCGNYSNRFNESVQHVVVTISTSHMTRGPPSILITSVPRQAPILELNQGLLVDRTTTFNPPTRAKDPVMAQFDEIVQSGDDPVRHHTFYFDDGTVVLNVSRPIPTENYTYHSV